MTKLVIRNESEQCSDSMAVSAVQHVIDNGLASETGHAGKQYCFVTVFKSPEILVYVHKYKSGTHTFYVRDDNKCWPRKKKTNLESEVTE